MSRAIRPDPRSVPEQRPRRPLLEEVRRQLRVHRKGRRTESAYVSWIRRFILYHGKRHPSELRETEVNAYLTHLATDRRVSASTQNQALCALLFLYRHVLGVGLKELDLVRAPRRRKLPVVLSRAEVRAVLSHLDADAKLVLSLLYGTGMRLLEGLRLRVKDVDFERGRIVVRDGKGEKDRVTMLPASLVDPLREHLRLVRAAHEEAQRRRRAPLRSRAEVPGSGSRVVLAVRLPGCQALERSEVRRVAPAPHPRKHHSEGLPTGSPRGEGLEACRLSHAEAFLRHPSARRRLRHPDDPGAPGPQGHTNHHDLRPRARPGARRREPVGPFLRGPDDRRNRVLSGRNPARAIRTGAVVITRSDRCEVPVVQGPSLHGPVPIETSSPEKPPISIREVSAC